MLKLGRCRLYLLAWLALATAMQSDAQSAPGALVRIPASVFVQAGDTYTGLSGATNFLGGRNVSVTAGLDLGILRVNRYTLSAEGRGTYALYRGHVDGQDSLLGGVRLDHQFEGSKLSRLLLYGNVLAGRGEEHYVNGGFPTATLLYSESSGAVYSTGFGFEIAAGHHLSYKGEAEVQRWGIPVTTAGVIYAKQGSGGVVYRFAGPKIR